MSEFQLTHVALVGARMDVFRRCGFQSRDELSLCRVVPADYTPLSSPGSHDVRSTLRLQLPVWVHNIITDTQFPGRDSFLMPLRRFEGELFDSKGNEVISAVLSAGFKNQTLDPLDLPATMPMRQRCALVMHIGIWQEAYQELEHDLVEILAGRAAELDSWCDRARQPEHAFID